MNARKVRNLRIYTSILVDLLKMMDGTTRYRLQGLPADATVVAILTDSTRDEVIFRLYSEEFSEVAEGAAIPDLKSVEIDKVSYRSYSTEVGAPPETPADPSGVNAWEPTCRRWIDYARSLENDICLLTSELNTISRILTNDYFADNETAKLAYEQGWREAMNQQALRNGMRHRSNVETYADVPF